MPELPEVQTVLDTLAVQIKDAGIKDIRIIFPKIIEGDAEEFRRRLIGQHFRLFRRRGKYLLFEMDDLTMVSHLRMEGKYYIYDKKVTPGKHDHVVFELDDGRYLHYNDVRKFGRMGLMDKKRTYIRFHDLGPEPFWDSFNADYCRKYLKERKAEIKPTLLDQSFVAGIGNIYADEALFLAGIHPLRPVGSLSAAECQRLHQSVNTVIAAGIRDGGTTFRDYKNGEGKQGSHQEQLYVYNRQGQPCRRCGTEIEKMTVGGRGTHLCPQCQRP